MGVTNSKTVYGVSVAFLGLGAVALALLALLTMMACGESAEKPGPSPHTAVRHVLHPAHQ